MRSVPVHRMALRELHQVLCPTRYPYGATLKRLFAHSYADAKRFVVRSDARQTASATPSCPAYAMRSGLPSGTVFAGHSSLQFAGNSAGCLALMVLGTHSRPCLPSTIASGPSPEADPLPTTKVLPSLIALETPLLCLAALLLADGCAYCNNLGKSLRTTLHRPRCSSSFCLFDLLRLGYLGSLYRCVATDGC